MDMRAFGKGYTAYYERATQDVRRRLHPLPHLLRSRRTRPTATCWCATRTRTASSASEEFDMVVLSVGMETSPQAAAAGRERRASS